MKSIVSGFLITLIVIITSSCHAQRQKYEKAIKISTDSIELLMKKRMIPGLAITVSINHEIVWSQGFGYADLEQKVKVDPAKTKFRIGSISKSLTAIALGRLYEQNKIILDSSIYYYLPDYPKHKYRPTIFQIGGHIGGIRSYRGNEFFIATRFKNVQEGLSIFKDDTLIYKPGSQYQYTSYGFNLLSAAMEKAAKKNFLAIMRTEVFRPLQLINTSPDINDSIIDYRSRFYALRHGKVLNAPYVDNSYKWAGGGFISSSEDVTKFANAVLSNKLIKKETLNLLITPQLLLDGKHTSYGLGFFSQKDKKSNFHFGHSGGSVGGTSDMVIYPTEEIAVVILTNLSNANLGETANNVAHYFSAIIKK